jgi:hypothetical protein
MKAGDMFLCLTTSTGIWSSHMVSVAASGAIDLSIGATIADERLIRSEQVSNWVEEATAEVEALKTAAKADPKTFFGNRVRGMGDGLSRVRALLFASKDIEQALSQLNRVL